MPNDSPTTQEVNVQRGPELRSKEGALQYLAYHAPNPEQKQKHSTVNASFQKLLSDVWDSIPDGPGKTIFIRSLNEARMKANSAIANHGC